MKPEELQRIIDRLGVNQRTVAKAIGVSEAAVSRWLAHNREIPRPTAMAIRGWAKTYQKAG